MLLQLPAACFAAFALTAACSGGGSSHALKPTPTPTPSATASPTPSPTPAPVDLLTGLPSPASGPLVAIKVDNAVLARPYQTGLSRAAVVYQELVEGGSTRLLAVFESSLAGLREVGPIRSVRESDVELVRQFGKIDIGFSGGNTGVKAIVRTAARNGWLIDASYDVRPGAYRLGAQRRDARNFFAVPSALAAHPGNGAVDIGLRFGAPAVGGVPLASAVATYAAQSRVTLRYNPAAFTWSVAQDGRLMGGVGPANVVIQRVVERPSGFRDVHGQPTPYTVTAGAGAVTVLRDGQRFTGTWKRAGHGATHFLGASGKDIPLRPGPTWVLLVPTSGGISFG